MVFKEIKSCTLVKIFLLVFDDSEDESLGAGGEQSEAPGYNYHHPGPGSLFDRVDGAERSGDADESKNKTSRPNKDFFSGILGRLRNFALFG